MKMNSKTVSKKAFIIISNIIFILDFYPHKTINNILSRLLKPSKKKRIRQTKKAFANERIRISKLHFL